MTTIASPSELIPAPPVVSLALPEGREPVSASGALLSARKPGADGECVSNMLVRAAALPGVFLFHPLEPVVPGGVVNLLQLVGTGDGSAAVGGHPVIKTVFGSTRVAPWKAPSDVRV